jgi:hypothetical protein
MSDSAATRVMPAKADIHDLHSRMWQQSWMPAFAGMTDGAFADE